MSDCCIVYWPDEGSNLATIEFAMLPSSQDSLLYINNESPDTVWPGIYVYVWSWTFLRRALREHLQAPVKEKSNVDIILLRLLGINSVV